MNRVNLAYPVNTLWMLSCRRSLHAFNRSVRQVESTQSQVLRRIVRANQDSAYGRELGIAPMLAMLVPQRSPLGYHLLIDLKRESEQPSAARIAATLDLLLSENPWYEHAIRVGQLSPLTVTIDESGSARLWNAYEAKCLNSGIRRGDIKPTALEIRFDWDLTAT